MALKKEIDERTVRLVRYVIIAPNWKHSLIFSIAFSAIIGLGVFHYGSLVYDAVAGLLLLGIPSALSVFVTIPFLKPFDKSFTLNRSGMLSLASTIILGLFLGIGAVAEKILHRPEIFAAYVMGIGAILAIRLVVLITVSSRNVSKVIFPASIQTLISLPMLWFLYLNHYPPTDFYSTILLLVIYCFIFALAAYLFTNYMDRPLRKMFSISGLDFVRCFISRTDEGSDEIEKIFQKIGEPVDAPVSVLSFRSKNKQDLKAMFMVPMVHPGPMREIGGGALPSIVARSFDFTTFVLHGTAYHDFNLVSKSEIDKIVNVVKSSLSNMEYEPLASRSVSVIEENVKILGQRFGDSVLLVSTLSPESTEDIEFGVGLAAISEVRRTGARHAAIVDAHNCSEPYSKIILPGSKASYAFIKATTRASQLLMQSELSNIKIGVAKQPPIFTREEGMGDLGMLVAITEVLGQRTAYVLIDGNNMVTGLRDKIVEEIRATGIEHAEVMTTDTHVVNVNSGAIFIGAFIDHTRLISAIKELVKEAVNDLEEVEADLRTDIAEDIFIFGTHRTAQLATVASTIIAVGGAFAVSVIIAAISLSLLAFMLAG